MYLEFVESQSQCLNYCVEANSIIDQRLFFETLNNSPSFKCVPVRVPTGNGFSLFNNHIEKTKEN